MRAGGLGSVGRVTGVRVGSAQVSWARGRGGSGRETRKKTKHRKEREGSLWTLDGGSKPRGAPRDGSHAHSLPPPRPRPTVPGSHPRPRAPGRGTSAPDLPPTRGGGGPASGAQPFRQGGQGPHGRTTNDDGPRSAASPLESGGPRDSLTRALLAAWRPPRSQTRLRR